MGEESPYGNIKWFRSSLSKFCETVSKFIKKKSISQKKKLFSVFESQHTGKSPCCKTPCSPPAAASPPPPFTPLPSVSIFLSPRGFWPSESCRQQQQLSFREWHCQPRGRGTWSHGRKWTAAVLPRYSLMQLCLGRRQETLLRANCGNGAHDGAIVYRRLWVETTHRSVKRRVFYCHQTNRLTRAVTGNRCFFFSPNPYPNCC